MLLGDSLCVVLRCSDDLARKARYVLDTLLMAGGVPVTYVAQPPASGPWLLYGIPEGVTWPFERCASIAHCAKAWRYLEGKGYEGQRMTIGGLVVPFPESSDSTARADIPFDLVANAFYFLASWHERTDEMPRQGRKLYVDSIYARFDIPQDIVDQYLWRLMQLISGVCDRLGLPRWKPARWPEAANHALVLSHDVDFIPRDMWDIAVQGAKSVFRHLVRERDPWEAVKAAAGLVRALGTGKDPYGCVPEIIRHEQELGVRASFQIAVAHRHPDDVNYRIEDNQIRDYLRVIPDSGFDLCLHGSYRSTENPDWYLEEVALLTERLGRPMGSRQHYLSFDYDRLFTAQERGGIQYDMSMGYPDHIGPRAGFSYPYFPYCVAEDRPYDVVQISLALMDVTLRSYMGLKGAQAWEAIESVLTDLHQKGGCVSVVWHPIVFGGARDPGYDRLYWNLVDDVRRRGGLATDGRTVNSFWRDRARSYSTFASLHRY